MNDREWKGQVYKDIAIALLLSSARGKLDKNYAQLLTGANMNGVYIENENGIKYKVTISRTDFTQ